MLCQNAHSTYKLTIAGATAAFAGVHLHSKQLNESYRWAGNKQVANSGSNAVTAACGSFCRFVTVA